MIEIACKSCGQTVPVNSLLAAAQEPCPHCRKPLMGEVGASSLREPPRSHFEPVTPKVRKPPEPFNFMPLIIGILAGIVLALAIAVFGKGLNVGTHGMILGMLAGVLAAPLIALNLFLSAMWAKFYWQFSLVPGIDEILSESLMDGVARAVNERRFGKVGCFIMVFIVLGMGLGALFGSLIEEGVSQWLVAFAVLGGGALGAFIGLVVTPFFPAPPPEPTEGDSEKEKP